MFVTDALLVIVGARSFRVPCLRCTLGARFQGYT